MKSNRINYLVVGFFVIAMLAGLVASVAVLTGRTGATDTYYTSYRDVSGIKFGTQVLYMGYPIGQVEAVEPVAAGEGGMSFRVRLGVEQGWQIPRDSRAEITVAGLLSAYTIDIRGGSSSEYLQPGARIPGAERTDLFGAVSDTARTVQKLAEEGVQPLLVNLNRYLDSFGRLIEGDASGMAEDLRGVTAELAKQAPGIIGDFREVSAQLRETSGRLRALLGPETTQRIDATLDNVQEVSSNFRQVSEDAMETSRRLEKIVDADTARKIDSTLDNFTRASANLAKLSEDLHQTRSEIDRLVGLLGDAVGERGDAIGQSIEDLRHILHAVAQNITSVSYNLEGTSRNMYELSRELRRNPGLLLGGKPPADDAAAE